jgi:hydroxymethylbilane synthase
MKGELVIGSRGSKLALIQAESVAHDIRRMNPGVEIVIRRIVTQGDRDGSARLENIAGLGVFVKELEDALLDRRIDLAVHSLKDMTTEIPIGLKLVAVMERTDPRDVLISREGRPLDELPSGARLGTSSMRRKIQLGVYRPDFEICSIRGNIDTRIRKVNDGDYDGITLAAAALKRLGLEHKISEYLPTEPFLPAVGQGALGIEIRSGDKDTACIAAPLNHLTTWQSITAERAFLHALGGGCRAPIAALAKLEGNSLCLSGMVGDVAKGKILYASEEGEASNSEEIGIRLAGKLLAMGGDRIIAEVRKNESR